MKRLITMVLFAVLAVPVFAAENSAPFEQAQLDRSAALGPSNGSAAAGATASAPSRSVWSGDYNFIAPAK